MSQAFILLQRLLPQHLLSRITGALASCRVGFIRRVAINTFIRVYKVDMTEAIVPPGGFDSFNQFFTRQLKPGARPIEGELSCPADGAMSMVGNIVENRLIQAKGISYELKKLLGGLDTKTFERGAFATIYLAPRDYHRVHMPVDGTLTQARYIPGHLFSVNPTTTASIPDLFAGNERLVLWFETAGGPMCMVLVGAMIVAGIKTVWRDAPYSARELVHESLNLQFTQGDEVGQFQLGSTVIIILPHQPAWTVIPGDKVRMGQAMVESGQSR